MSEITMSVDRLENIISVFGSFDENLKQIEEEFRVNIIDRNSELTISGDEENIHFAQRTINGLLTVVAKGESIDAHNVRYIISIVREGQDDKIGAISRDIICISAKGKPVKAKTLGQMKYVDAINSSTVTLAIGPAGTGKTYLAVAHAVAAFRAKSVNRIILTRPAVEAGERLGFLPAICKARSIRTCGRCMTHFLNFWERIHTTNILNAEILRSLPWHICAGGILTIHLLFSTKHKTPHASR